MSKTLRILMPQWQGGNNQAYYFGAILLSWLVPNENNQKEVSVPVAKPSAEHLKKKMELSLKLTY